MVVGVFAAYALARLRLPAASTSCSGVILGASMFPGVALVTPLFQLFTNIGWIGHLPGADHPEHLVRAAADGLHPDGVLPRDAVGARGGGPDRRLHARRRRSARSSCRWPRRACSPPRSWRSSPRWNEFLLASQLSTDKTQPVTVAIASFTGAQPHQEPYTAVMAAGTIVTVPLVIMVLLFQRAIVSGLTAGGVKG